MNKENEQFSQNGVIDVLCKGNKIKIYFTERPEAGNEENKSCETENIKNKNSLNVNKDTAEKSPENKVQQPPTEENRNIDDEDNSLIDLMQEEFQGFMKEKREVEEKYMNDLVKLKNNYKEKKIKIKNIKNKLRIKYKEKKEKLQKDFDNTIQNSKNKFKMFFKERIKEKIKLERFRRLNELKNLIESNKIEDAMTLINQMINNNFRADSLNSDNSSDKKTLQKKGKFETGHESSGANNKAKKE